MTTDKTKEVLDLIDSKEEVLKEYVLYLNKGDLIEIVEALVKTLKEEVKWRLNIDNELSSCHMVASDDPRESIHRLINWHTEVQLDPRVSSAALDLYKKGFADGEAHCKEQAVKITEQKTKDLVTLLKLEL